MNIKVFGFDWDIGNSSKCEKHGLTKELIEQFFQSEIWIALDVKHSQVEDRFLAIGRSPTNGKPMIVVFTYRFLDEEKQVIRPISARYMHDKEVKIYAQEFTKNDQ